MIDASVFQISLLRNHRAILVSSQVCFLFSGDLASFQAIRNFESSRDLNSPSCTTPMSGGVCMCVYHPGLLLQHLCCVMAVSKFSCLVLKLSYGSKQVFAFALLHDIIRGDSSFEV